MLSWEILGQGRERVPVYTNGGGILALAPRPFLGDNVTLGPCVCAATLLPTGSMCQEDLGREGRQQALELVNQS